MGKNLLSAIDKNSCVRILNNGKSTRVHGNNSYPDVAICSLDIDHRLHWDVVEDSMGSDHFPLSIEVDGFLDQNTNGKTKFRLSKVRWDDFNDFILQNMESLPTPLLCVDEALSSFIDLIHRSLTASGGSSSSPSYLNSQLESNRNAEHCILKNSRNKFSKSAIWWNEDCNKEVGKRKEALRKFKLNPSSENLLTYY